MAQYTTTQFKEHFLTLGLNLKIAWLNTQLENMKNKNNLSFDEIVGNLFHKMLISDLGVISLGLLPQNCELLNEKQLEKRTILQVNRMINIGTKHKKKEKETKHRCLKFLLTDGIQEMSGFEYHRIPTIKIDDDNNIPGFKVVVTNTEIRHGHFLLSQNNCKKLGGYVQSLKDLRMNQQQL
ncbi:recq-mediated genome instability protein 1 rmi1 [Anaeramoeba flamelloides]|uniref:RecQ-mediated genome instability protein 1 n=1 Tax=Anaeramoeba flamelloides TaxID=1746091 RepID=A0AAV7ZC78_9EUKA|nr:recq-mediated genome instability protein 1 rmi1 [Anaeramoeba flamelloides]